MAKSLFPEEMMKSGELNLETIAGKLTYFHEQLHLTHWQTTSYAEHKSLGKLYEYVPVSYTHLTLPTICSV